MSPLPLSLQYSPPLTMMMGLAKRPTSLHLGLILFFYFSSILSTTSKAANTRRVFANSVTVYPSTCNTAGDSCTSDIYHVSHGLSVPEIAGLYSGNASLIAPITKKGRTDYLVTVPCTCESYDSNNGNVSENYYFHDTRYAVKAGDTAENVTNGVFGGKTYGLEEEKMVAGEVITVRVPCGCHGGGEGGQELVVTYTVEQGDTLSSIAALLRSDVEGIHAMNERLTADPEFLSPGWVLFVPMGTADVSPAGQARRKKISIITWVIIVIAFLIAGASISFFFWRYKSKQHVKDPEMKTEKAFSKISTIENQYNNNGSNKDLMAYQTEGPLIFSLEEVAAATANFDETRKIGEGGFGSVFFGMLRNQEVAIKMMKSNKTKEFFAELKVLCKVHHINVVELIGYASGDDHLYLVYEYVQNGSLGDHLHDPLRKGHQPLSWTARAQIALDSARGIEYIHDHTKARYVHRDIKTSNILLDGSLRAKIADFGLAKLVERSGEDDSFATRLVGTPGYLPPESVCELKMTTKTDVFAFGVVLAELITGSHALFRDNKEINKMKSLISVIRGVFHGENSETELEAIVDGNLKDNYPTEEVHKMAEISVWCLNENATDRPEMGEIVTTLAQILVASLEWEASLGGNSRVFSGVFTGR